VPAARVPVLTSGRRAARAAARALPRRRRLGLFATSTFWQGVDIQGESLSLLVIDKLPFAAPGDPLVEARCERIAREGGDWFTEYALPAAVLQLRQGSGG
jgi:ATP-dependent DNA helicase DinG